MSNSPRYEVITAGTDVIFHAPDGAWMRMTEGPDADGNDGWKIDYSFDPANPNISETDSAFLQGMQLTALMLGRLPEVSMTQEEAAAYVESISATKN